MQHQEDDRPLYVLHYRSYLGLYGQTISEFRARQKERSKRDAREQKDRRGGQRTEK